MVVMSSAANEIGMAPARGRPVVANEQAEEELSAIKGERVVLPKNAVVHGSPTTCPACGSSRVMWGCDPDQTVDREAIHPLVWHPTQWMADSFISQACNAGWIEPDEAEAITWVRPYWLVTTA